MSWAVWLGSSIFAVTVVGMLWMRNRPVTDEQGRPVDEFGRLLRSFDRCARQIVKTLLDEHNAPMTAYAIRNRLRISRQQFYQVLDQLVGDGLLEQTVDSPSSTANAPVLHYYRLTDHGVVEGQLPAKTQRGRHRG